MFILLLLSHFFSGFAGFVRGLVIIPTTHPLKQTPFFLLFSKIVLRDYKGGEVPKNPRKIQKSKNPKIPKIQKFQRSKNQKNQKNQKKSK
jgi:hypothetical protein